jgi:hypothetical protein
MNEKALHIEFEKITDLILGTLSERETTEITEHLAICSNCAKLKMRVENTIFAMQTDKLEEVPTHILERTFDLLNERKKVAATSEKASFLKKIVAVFTDESSNLTPIFGLRSKQTENSKRFWLQAEDAEIDLRLDKSDEKWKVAGQVFGEVTGGEAFLQSNENVFTTELSELCEFSFSEIPNGKYRLFIYFRETEIEIPAINIE